MPSQAGTYSPHELQEDPRQNRILAALPPSDYERLLPDLEPVSLPLGSVIFRFGDHESCLHFPTSGIVALVNSLQDGSSSEVALVGNEGLVGTSTLFGGESILSSTLVQSEIRAYQLSRRIAKKEFELGGHLHDLALRFTQSLLAQTSQISLCNQHHTVEQQLCRWLLMSADRLPDNNLVITHEAVSNLLGVRRESISQAARKLKEEGLIAYGRGKVTINDRVKLEERVCECYSSLKGSYDRLLPPGKFIALDE